MAAPRKGVSGAQRSGENPPGLTVFSSRTLQHSDSDMGPSTEAKLQAASGQPSNLRRSLSGVDGSRSNVRNTINPSAATAAGHSSAPATSSKHNRVSLSPSGSSLNINVSDPLKPSHKRASRMANATKPKVQSSKPQHTTPLTPPSVTGLGFAPVQDQETRALYSEFPWTQLQNNAKDSKASKESQHTSTKGIQIHKGLQTRNTSHTTEQSDKPLNFVAQGIRVGGTPNENEDENIQACSDIDGSPQVPLLHRNFNLGDIRDRSYRYSYHGCEGQTHESDFALQLSRSSEYGYRSYSNDVVSPRAIAREMRNITFAGTPRSCVSEISDSSFSPPPFQDLPLSVVNSPRVVDPRDDRVRLQLCHSMSSAGRLWSSDELANVPSS